MNEQLRTAVIEQITLAFDGVERGSGTTLHEAHAIDYHHPTAVERAVARLLDTETRWQDVSDWDIEHHHSFLSFLDAEGFHYYAPACMVWSARHFDTSSSAMSDMTIYTFVFDDDDSAYAKWHLDRWSLFTREQRRAVYVFLRLMTQNPTWVDARKAAEALDSYWGRFGDSISAGA